MLLTAKSAAKLPTLSVCGTLSARLGHQHQAIGLAKQALLGQVRRGPVRDQLDVAIDVRQPGSEQEPIGTGKKLA